MISWASVGFDCFVIHVFMMKRRLRYLELIDVSQDDLEEEDDREKATWALRR